MKGRKEGGREEGGHKRKEEKALRKEIEMGGRSQR